MTDSVYRFLPWARRGLSAALPKAVDGDAVRPRAAVAIEVVVGGAGTIPTATTLHGPGDVIGLDPTVIVRTVPRAGATNVEPNYLAAVDFDQPELPWLFTPTGVPANRHLRPWLVLVVVEDRPGVTIQVPAGSPLPRLRIESGAAKELPDLSDSWAWAHAQLLDQEAGATTQTVGKALVDRPDHNVSRLVCPRRLAPGKRWYACLVPAYDAGVVRGLGGTPGPADLKPAWEAPDAVELPVYYHWQFQTGPQGDFESLARRLQPYEASARIGRISMHVGAATPFLEPITGERRFLDMDGALQAPAIARSSAQPPVPDQALSDVPDALRTGLQDVTRILADAADGKLDGQSPEESDALGPPVYDGAHIQRTSVGQGDPTWFQELNTDPRSRVAAGLGAEVLRTYQEDVMEACWRQVGDVISLQTTLSRARLSLEVGLRFTARHLEPLTPGRYLQMTAPMAARTMLDGTSLPAAIAPTSLPDRTTDPAMRRYLAPRGQIVSGIARRTPGDAGMVQAVRAAGEKLVTTLSAGRSDVDPTRFPVLAIEGLPSAVPQADAEGNVALQQYGVGVVLDKASASLLGTTSRALTAVPVPAAEEVMKPRPDLRSAGLITSQQLAVARETSFEQLAALSQAGQQLSVAQSAAASSSSVLDAVLVSSVEQPSATGFLLETGPQVVARPLGLRGRGDVVVLNDRGANVPVARIDPRLRAAGTLELGELIGRLPANSIRALNPRRGGSFEATEPVSITAGTAHGEVVATQVGAPSADLAQPMDPGPATRTMPPLVRDSATLDRYVTAVAQLVERTALGSDPPRPGLVGFALAAAVDATRQRSDPALAQPARLDTMVSVAGHSLAAIRADPGLVPAWRLPALVDRVMAYPQLDLAAYSYLAEYDRTRFCPGVDEVPPDSITLLETNPRFVAAFMGGLNHETNKELLWRGYPSDGRGTPWRKFWRRADNGQDIGEIQTWGKRGNRDDLPAQTTDPQGNLVLLVRGDLLRRYPRTMVVAVKAITEQEPSRSASDVLTPVFAGAFDPDVSFFGFPLVSQALTTDPGWFFGLLEPVTEPRFGFDETVGRQSAAPATWNDVAWPDLGVAPSGPLTSAKLAAIGLPVSGSSVGQADGVAAALFQRPFKLLVHSSHLVKGV